MGYRTASGSERVCAPKCRTPAEATTRSLPLAVLYHARNRLGIQKESKYK
jgi:hypothetical protein